MGLYTIITRADGIVLTGTAPGSSDIWNVDHQNHVTHTEPSSINSFEATTTQMNIEIDPSPLGVPSLPAAFSDELARLRFVLTTLKKLISGGTAPHWYSAIGTFSSAFALPPTACRLEATVTQTIPNNFATAVNFNSVIYDTTGSSMHTALANPRLLDGIVAPSTGNYIIGGSVAFTANPGISGDFKIFLFRTTGDSINTASAEDQISSGATNMHKAATVEGVLHLIKGEQVFLFVLQNSGSPQAITLAGGLLSGAPALWGALIGR
jgi:hypothetical protein